MGGFILDVIIAYLIKSALRLRRAWGSSKWQRVQAKIDSSWLGGGWVWNCPTAEVAYTYEFAGQTYSAIDSNPLCVVELSKVLGSPKFSWRVHIFLAPGKVLEIRRAVVADHFRYAD